MSSPERGCVCDDVAARTCSSSPAEDGGFSLEPNDSNVSRDGEAKSLDDVMDEVQEKMKLLELQQREKAWAEQAEAERKRKVASRQVFLAMQGLTAEQIVDASDYLGVRGFHAERNDALKDLTAWFDDANKMWYIPPGVSPLNRRVLLGTYGKVDLNAEQRQKAVDLQMRKKGKIEVLEINGRGD